MPLYYASAVRFFASSIFICGMIYLLGCPRTAGFSLMALGTVGLVMAIGSAIGWLDVIGRDGMIIPPAEFVKRSSIAVSPSRRTAAASVSMTSLSVYTLLLNTRIRCMIRVLTITGRVPCQDQHGPSSAKGRQISVAFVTKRFYTLSFSPNYGPPQLRLQTRPQPSRFKTYTHDRDPHVDLLLAPLPSHDRLRPYRHPSNPLQT